MQIVADRKSEQIICGSVHKGKAHDGTIFKNSLSIRSSIQVLADSGYRGVQKRHRNTLYPIKHREDIKRLSKSEQKEQRVKNREISSMRMKIEHIIGRIKRFKIMRERYRNRRKRFVLRLNLICGIVNYENPRKFLIS